MCVCVLFVLPRTEIVFFRDYSIPTSVTVVSHKLVLAGEGKQIHLVAIMTKTCSTSQNRHSNLYDGPAIL